MIESSSLSVPDDLRRRFQQGISWNVLGALFTQGSAFLANLIIANFLGREVFGEFGMIQSTVLTLAGIAQVASGTTATKYIAEFRSTDKERAGRVLGFCALMTLIAGALATILLIAGAPWLAKYVLDAPHLNTGIIIAAGYVLFSVMNGYQVGALAGLEGFRAIAISGAVQGFLHLTLCGLATWLFGLEGALAGLALSATARWLIFGWAIRYEAARQAIVPSRVGLASERKIFFGFALPAALTGLSSLPALWLGNAFLVQQPGGFSEMGSYSAANNLRVVVLFLPMLLNSVGMSLLNNERGLGDESRYRRVFWFNIRLTTASAIVSALVVALFGSWLLRLFGEDFVDGHHVLLILMLSTVPEAVAVAAYQPLHSLERMWLSLLAVAVPRDLVLIIGAYWLTSTYGATGLASAYTIAWIVALLVIVSLVGRIGLRPYVR